MTVLEWKLENSVIVTDENFEFLEEIELFTKAKLVKGSKFLDALLDEPGSPFNGSTVHLMDSELDLFEIVYDPEWNDGLSVAEQKFRVKLK